MLTGAGATSFAYAALALAETSTGHHLHLPVSATQSYYQSVSSKSSDYPDPLHTAEPDATFYTGWYGGGTAVANPVVGPEPNIFGD